MKLQDFLDHDPLGAPPFMHGVAQEALRPAAELDTGYRTPRRRGGDKDVPADAIFAGVPARLIRACSPPIEALATRERPSRRPGSVDAVLDGSFVGE